MILRQTMFRARSISYVYFHIETHYNNKVPSLDCSTVTFSNITLIWISKGNMDSPYLCKVLFRCLCTVVSVYIGDTFHVRKTVFLYHKLKWEFVNCGAVLIMFTGHAVWTLHTHLDISLFSATCSGLTRRTYNFVNGHTRIFAVAFRWTAMQLSTF